MMSANTQLDIITEMLYDFIYNFIEQQIKFYERNYEVKIEKELSVTDRLDGVVYNKEDYYKNRDKVLEVIDRNIDSLCFYVLFNNTSNDTKNSLINIYDFIKTNGFTKSLSEEFSGDVIMSLKPAKFIVTENTSIYTKVKSNRDAFNTTKSIIETIYNNFIESDLYTEYLSKIKNKHNPPSFDDTRVTLMFISKGGESMKDVFKLKIADVKEILSYNHIGIENKITRKYSRLLDIVSIAQFAQIEFEITTERTQVGWESFKNSDLYKKIVEDGYQWTSTSNDNNISRLYFSLKYPMDIEDVMMSLHENNRYSATDIIEIYPWINKLKLTLDRKDLYLNCTKDLLFYGVKRIGTKLRLEFHIHGGIGFVNNYDECNKYVNDCIEKLFSEYIDDFSIKFYYYYTSDSDARLSDISIDIPFNTDNILLNLHESNIFKPQEIIDMYPWIENPDRLIVNLDDCDLDLDLKIVFENILVVGETLTIKYNILGGIELGANFFKCHQQVKDSIRRIYSEYIDNFEVELYALGFTTTTITRFAINIPFDTSIDSVLLSIHENINRDTYLDVIVEENNWIKEPHHITVRIDEFKFLYDVDLIFADIESTESEIRIIYNLSPEINLIHNFLLHSDMIEMAIKKSVSALFDKYINMKYHIFLVFDAIADNENDYNYHDIINRVVIIISYDDDGELVLSLHESIYDNEISDELRVLVDNNIWITSNHDIKIFTRDNRYIQTLHSTYEKMVRTNNSILIQYSVYKADVYICKSMDNKEIEDLIKPFIKKEFDIFINTPYRIRLVYKSIGRSYYVTSYIIILPYNIDDEVLALHENSTETNYNLTELLKDNLWIKENHNIGYDIAKYSGIARSEDNTHISIVYSFIGGVSYDLSKINTDDVNTEVKNNIKKVFDKFITNEYSIYLHSDTNGYGEYEVASFSIDIKWNLEDIMLGINEKKTNSYIINSKDLYYSIYKEDLDLGANLILKYSYKLISLLDINFENIINLHNNFNFKLDISNVRYIKLYYEYEADGFLGGTFIDLIKREYSKKSGVNIECITVYIQRYVVIILIYIDIENELLGLNEKIEEWDIATQNTWVRDSHDIVIKTHSGETINTYKANFYDMKIYSGSYTIKYKLDKEIELLSSSLTGKSILESDVLRAIRTLFDNYIDTKYEIQLQTIFVRNDFLNRNIEKILSFLIHVSFNIEAELLSLNENTISYTPIELYNYLYTDDIAIDGHILSAALHYRTISTIDNNDYETWHNSELADEYIDISKIKKITIIYKSKTKLSIDDERIKSEYSKKSGIDINLIDINSKWIPNSYRITVDFNINDILLSLHESNNNNNNNNNNNIRELLFNTFSTPSIIIGSLEFKTDINQFHLNSKDIRLIKYISDINDFTIRYESNTCTSETDRDLIRQEFKEKYEKINKDALSDSNIYKVDYNCYYSYTEFNYIIAVHIFIDANIDNELLSLHESNNPIVKQIMDSIYTDDLALPNGVIAECGVLVFCTLDNGTVTHDVFLNSIKIKDINLIRNITISYYINRKYYDLVNDNVIQYVLHEYYKKSGIDMEVNIQYSLHKCTDGDYLYRIELTIPYDMSIDNELFGINENIDTSDTWIEDDYILLIKTPEYPDYEYEYRLKYNSIINNDSHIIIVYELPYVDICLYNGNEENDRITKELVEKSVRDIFNKYVSDYEVAYGLSWGYDSNGESCEIITEIHIVIKKSIDDVLLSINESNILNNKKEYINNLLTSDYIDINSIFNTCNKIEIKRFDFYIIFDTLQFTFCSDHEVMIDYDTLKNIDNSMLSIVDTPFFSIEAYFVVTSNTEHDRIRTLLDKSLNSVGLRFNRYTNNRYVYNRLLFDFNLKY